MAAAFFLIVAPLLAGAQGMRPPPFLGGVPGMNQMRAIVTQRHQARTLLYREAIEELRRNPAAADVPECRPDEAPNSGCLARPRPTLGDESPRIRKRIALLVGNTAYRLPIPPLETPIADADQVGAILQGRFGYETRVVRDGTKAMIVAALNAVAAETTPDDAVVLFYAGHGYLMDDTGMGYWIPVDGSVKTAAQWISNTDITKLLQAIPARQLILVSDSCFSGSLTREQKVSGGLRLARDELMRRRSVLVFSSGGEEPVSDEGKNGHSIFAWNLIRALEATDSSTPGFDLYRIVHGNVVREFPQEPQYGAVVSAGHAADGEFLFEPVRR